MRAPSDLILLRILQELDDLGELFFCFVDAGDVGERHLRAVLREHLRARAPERQRLAAAALRLPQNEEQQQHGDRQRPERHEAREQSGVRLLVEADRAALDAMIDLVDERLVDVRERRPSTWRRSRGRRPR